MNLFTNRKNENAGLVLALTLAFFSGLVCVITLTSIPADPKNTFLFGYSPVRLAVLAVVIAIMLVFGACLVTVLRSPQRAANWLAWLGGRQNRPRMIFVSALLLFVAAWLVGYWDPQRLGVWSAYLDRLRPLLTWVMFLMFLVGVGTLVFMVQRWPERWVVFRAWFHRLKYFVWGLAALALLLAAVVVLLGAGIGEGSHFWNKTGTPLLWIQILFSGLLAMLISAGAQVLQRKKNAAWFDVMLAVLLWVAALVIWWGTPIAVNTFSTAGLPPNFAPYPLSDARGYDLTAQSVLLGYGFNGRMVDKPVHIVFLVLLNALSGSDFNRLLLLQTAIFAAGPVLIFWLGRDLFGRGLGLTAAGLLVIKEWNALRATNLIQLTNSKMVMSEMLTGLGLLAFTLLLTGWLLDRGQKSWKLLAAGVVLGLTGLVRLNALLVLPAVALMIGAAWRFRGWRWLATCILLGTLMAVVMVPWAVRCGVLYGNPLLFITAKTGGVLVRERYNPESEKSGPSPTALAVPQKETEDADVEKKPAGLAALLSRMGDHYAHNLVTTFFMLPASPWHESLYQTLRTPYWDLFWDGRLVDGGWLMILLSVFLVVFGAAGLASRCGPAGLLPMAVALGYHVSTAVSLTSGGRYILPVDWVLPFYMAAGLVQIAAVAGRLLGWDRSSQIEWVQPVVEQGMDWRFSLRGLAGMVVFALLIGAVLPGVEAGFRQRFLPQTKQELVRDLLQTRGMAETGLSLQSMEQFLAQPQAGIMHGRALYPRYVPLGMQDGLYTRELEAAYFTFSLKNQQAAYIYWQTENPPEKFASGLDTVVLGCEQNGKWFARLVVAAGEVKFLDPALTPCQSGS